MRNLLLAAILVLGQDALGKPVGSVKVVVSRLDGEFGPISEVAVRVFIGAKRVYQTFWASVRRPVWNKTVRVFSAAGNSLRFEVMARGQGARDNSAKRTKTDSRAGDKHESLAEGFEELVGDYEDGETDKEQRVENRASKESELSEESKVCVATLSWPPKDGVHRLACGKGVLEVQTYWVGTAK